MKSAAGKLKKFAGNNKAKENKQKIAGKGTAKDGKAKTQTGKEDSVKDGKKNLKRKLTEDEGKAWRFSSLDINLLE